jgi:hypothetical protein
VVSPIKVQLIRPGQRALDQFRRLSWGNIVRLPSYRAVPVRRRHGAYDEPFYQHYFDPYFDFATWVTLTELVAGRGWPGIEYEVVDDSGQRLFGSKDALGQAAIGIDLPADVTPVRIAGGQLVIDPAVPELGDPDPGGIVDPRVVVGYGGGGALSDGGAHDFEGGEGA